MAVIRDRYILDLDVGGAIGNANNFKQSLLAIGSTKNILLGVAAAAAAIGTAIVSATRDFAQVERQLKLVTDSSGELNNVVTQLRDSAARTNGSFNEMAGLFSRVSLATQNLGVSQSEVINFTEQFSRAMSIAGVDAGTAAGLLTQLGQAMGSGVVRGDEFNSIVEALGPALNIMAEESGLNISQLRAMAEAGELTSEAFFNMINNSAALRTAFDDMGTSAVQAEGNIGEGFTRLLVVVGQLAEDVTGLGALYTNTMQGIANTTNSIAQALEIMRQEQAIDAFDVDTANLNEFISLFQDIGLAGGQAQSAIIEVRDRIADLESQLANQSIYDSLFGEDTALIEAQLAKLRDVQAALAAIVNTNINANIDQSILDAFIPPDAAQRIQGYIDAASAAKTPLEALRREQQLLNEDIQKLQAASAAVSLEGIEPPFGGWDAAIAAAQARLAELQADISELEIDPASFRAFYDSLIEGSETAVDRTQFATWAIEDLSSALANGAITPEVYAEAMSRMNQQLGIANVESLSFSERMAELNAAMMEQAANNEFQRAAIEQLNQQYLTGAIGIDYYREAVGALGGSFEEQMAAAGNYMAYIEDLKATIEDSIAADEFKQTVIENLTAAFNSGSIGPDMYAEAMRRLGAEVEITAGGIANVIDEMDRLNDAAGAVLGQIDERVARDRERAELSGLSGVARELRGIELEERRLAEAAKERLQTQFGEGVDTGALQGQFDAIDRAAAAAIAERQRYAREVEGNNERLRESQRSLRENSDRVRESTGALRRDSEEFRNAWLDRLIVRPEDTASFLANGRGGFDIGSLFGGLTAGIKSAVGGAAPPVYGPSTAPGAAPIDSGLTAEGATTVINNAVTYNINAVDALSFKQLLARDPAFLHSLVERAKGRIPGGR